MMKSSITLLSGKIYPDRSFTVGYVPQAKQGRAERQYENDLATAPETDYGAVADYLTGVNDIGGKFCSTREAPLLVKCPKSSREKRGAYGKHGITNFGKRFVKNAAILLQDKYGRERLGFATCTLPSMGRNTLNTINARISEISRRFYQKLRRKCEKSGHPFIYIGVVEIQEKRFERTSLPVPHLHFVYVAKRSVRSGYLFDTKFAYTAWNESTNEVLKYAGHEEIMGYGGHIGSVKLESIRSSAAAYLGKYISKGCGVVKAMQERGFDKFPKQWWTACMQCKEMFKNAVVRMDANTCKQLFYNLEALLHEGYVEWGRYVEVEWLGEYRKLGVSGRLSEEFYAWVR